MNFAEGFLPCGRCGCAIRDHTLRNGCTFCRRCTAHLEFLAALETTGQQTLPWEAA